MVVRHSRTRAFDAVSSSFGSGDRPSARGAVSAADEYREIEATLEEMGDPEARRLLEEGTDDIKKGRTRSAEEIFGEALIKGWRLGA